MGHSRGLMKREDPVGQSLLICAPISGPSCSSSHFASGPEGDTGSALAVANILAGGKQHTGFADSLVEKCGVVTDNEQNILVVDVKTFNQLPLATAANDNANSAPFNHNLTESQ